MPRDRLILPAYSTPRLRIALFSLLFLLSPRGRVCLV